LGLGLGTAKKVLIRAMKATPLQCETPGARPATPYIYDIYCLELTHSLAVKKM
jgi:hypothetical protein